MSHYTELLKNVVKAESVQVFWEIDTRMELEVQENFWR